MMSSVVFGLVLISALSMARSVPRAMPRWQGWRAWGGCVAPLCLAGWLLAREYTVFVSVLVLWVWWMPLMALVVCLHARRAQAAQRAQHKRPLAHEGAKGAA